MLPLLPLLLGAPPTLPTLVAVASDASDTELFAARELLDALTSVCPMLNLTLGRPTHGEAQIAVGSGAASALGVPLRTHMGNETYIVDTTGRAVADSIVLSGGVGSSRGTLYAVYRLLELLGWRFFAHDETSTPSACPASRALPQEDRFIRMPFEYRDNNQWQPVVDLSWARRVGYNGNAQPASRGASVTYASPPGFVHTSYALLAWPDKAQNTPPPALFKAHPEWFWPPPEQGGNATYGQLCWSNQSLVAYLQSQARRILRSQPDALILSVSQNDNGNRCRTPLEDQINDEEGSPMGALLRGVNAVADAVHDDFPHIAIDTLAYQWSRPATKKTRPRRNVIIRLCTIECDFGHPLTHPSNAAFQADMEHWSRISNRTWIWNYVTNFGSYFTPFPDWWVLADNIRYFSSHGVTGIFEEGTFFGEVMLGILRTSVKHAESARDEAAGDESSSTVSILLNSFLLIYLFTHPIFFFLLFGVVGSFRKGFRSQVRE